MINLFENYNQETQELHQSLKRAGYNHFTIVINDDGFLPDDVTSPYRFFTAYQIYEDDTPAFFNDIQNSVCVRLIIIQKKDLNLLKQFTIC